MDEGNRAAGNQPSADPSGSGPDETKKEKIVEINPQDKTIDADAGNQPSADPSGSGPDETKKEKIVEINPQDKTIDADAGNQPSSGPSGSGPDETKKEKIVEINPQDKISDAHAGDQPSAVSSGSGPDETKRRKMEEKNPQVKLSESESVLMAAEASNTLKSSTSSSALVPEEKENNEDPDILEEIQQRLSTFASSTYRVNDEELRKLIKTQPINKVELLNFLRSLDTSGSITPQNSSQKKGFLESLFGRSQPPPPVQVHPVVTGRTFGADGVILQRVSQSTNVVKTNEQDCDFIIVFCSVKSRVGSDVEAAMRKTPGGKPVILVLMHHTRDVDFSVDIKKWSDTYNNIKLEVHVLYHETQSGLLTCPRNDGAIQQIQKLLDTRNETVCVTQV